MKELLDRTGLLAVARGLRARWAAAGRPGMRFPTWDPGVAKDLEQRWDWVRYGALALSLARVLSERIPGDLAEVGVYRGETSRFIRKAAPGRRLHLFDTFEGFPQADREPENARDERFQDTSEITVRRALGDLENVEIHRGRFPESAAGLEDVRFAWVLLDLDVYPPTRAGLEFFYPRLSPGGYVWVHDYNSPESNSACRRAVSEFLEGRAERVVEIPDVWGSVVFRKLG